MSTQRKLMQNEFKRRSYAAFETLTDPREVLRCPYCGTWTADNFTVLAEVDMRSDGHAYSIYCRACDNFGPVASTLESAIRLWNSLDVATLTFDPKRSSAYEFLTHSTLSDGFRLRLGDAARRVPMLKSGRAEGRLAGGNCSDPPLSQNLMT